MFPFKNENVKSTNLYTEWFSFDQAKISNFGLSTVMSDGKDYYQASQGGRWPIKWYAPESVNYGTFSHKTDIWSFGVTLWEM